MIRVLQRKSPLDYLMLVILSSKRLVKMNMTKWDSDIEKHQRVSVLYVSVIGKRILQIKWLMCTSENVVCGVTQFQGYKEGKLRQFNLDPTVFGAPYSPIQLQSCKNVFSIDS